MEAVARVFDGYRKASHMFTVEEFCRDAQEALGGEVLGRDFAKALLELFVMDVKIDPTKRDSDRMKFIQARQQGSNKIGMSYRVMNGNYFSCANWMDERLVNCAPNREENEYLGYLPATIGGKQNPVMRLLAVLEIFGLASYEVRGGQNLEIFVRVTKTLRQCRGFFVANCLTLWYSVSVGLPTPFYGEGGDNPWSSYSHSYCPSQQV